MSTTSSPISELRMSPSPTVSPGSLIQQFATICTLHADRPAVTLDGKSLTYSELDRLSNRIASALTDRGTHAGTTIAICLERSVEMIAAMLAVVKTGAAYLPLDPGYPIARLTETVADAGPVAVITSPGLAERLRVTATPCLSIDLLAQHPATQLPPVAIAPETPAYVIYTSGSTGRPKGVVVSHHNVAHLISATQPCFHFTPDDVWTLFHSFAFDFSVWEIWGCLLTGGRLVIVPFGISRSPEEFHSLLVEERVTVLNQTPSAFVLLDRADAQMEARMPLAHLSLRVVIFGGEALSPASLRGWFARHGDRQPQLVNMYGITETTVHATFRRMLASDAEHERESLIGQPLPDLQIHLCDPQLRRVRPGEEGEICIGGPGVARGYHDRPALTADRFCYNPWGEPGSRLYRSGDLGRRREDGELVFLGRRDSQVKINGFRIELGEIETALLTHPAIVQACVIAHSEHGEAPRLAAYFVAQYGREPATRELSEFLAARLPAQMMPAFYQRLAVFPLTPNGKVDRSALPAPRPGAMLPDRRSLGAPTTLEDLIASIWRVVLKARAVSLDDHFYDVGGTSLLLIAVRTGLQEQLDRQIPVAWMFEYTTIRALARRLSEPVEQRNDLTCKTAPRIEDRSGLSLLAQST
jgi:amino acid adenylation domain-containing protein